MSKGEVTHLSTHHLPSMHCCWLLNRTGKEKQTLWVSVMVTLSMYHYNEHFFSSFVFIPIAKPNGQLILLTKCSVYHAKCLKIHYHLHFVGWGTHFVSLSIPGNGCAVFKRHREFHTPQWLWLLRPLLLDEYSAMLAQYHHSCCAHCWDCMHGVAKNVECLQ